MLNTELYSQRLKVCVNCETYVRKTNQCSKNKGGCGCFLTLKARLKDAKCPMDKWPV